MPVVSAAKKEEIFNRKQEEKRFQVERRVASKVDEYEDEGLDLGDLLRYLIIAAIVVAIFLFFGGQAVQISKSME